MDNTLQPSNFSSYMTGLPDKAIACMADVASLFDQVGPGMDFIYAFSSPLCLIGQDLQVIRSNPLAREYLRAENGDCFLRLLNQSIADKPQELRRQVRNALAKECRISFLLQTLNFQPLVCTIRPIARADKLSALVSLTSLTGDSRAVIPYLRQIYKLSNAEAAIAAIASSGEDLIEIARRRQVTINTLRAQIASIKAKMGLSRMTEIAVTVCRIDAAVNWL